LLRFHRTPSLLQQLFPQFTWRKAPSSPTVYLTFDDGPVPEVTEFVLEQLRDHGAKATFFCVGDNLRKHPAVAERVVREGHALANHTFHHLSGWETPPAAYLENIRDCDRQLEAIRGEEKRKTLFRPPYGKISRKQMHMLRPEYELVMWDVLSYDFDASLSPPQCLDKTLAGTRPGSIVLFHDSLKAAPNLTYVLPRYLERLSGIGYTFAAL
jgi:peptidoglycan-N-acetylglucosamine deacetylase